MAGAKLPIIDVDRQSMILRLNGKDCRYRLWYAPSDGYWYQSLEVPVNNIVIDGRRVTKNAPLLPDNLANDLLAGGNIWCRTADVIDDPQGRDAFPNLHRMEYEVNGQRVLPKVGVDPDAELKAMLAADRERRLARRER